MLLLYHLFQCLISIWIEQLNKAGIETIVAYGADEAIAFIEKITDPRSTPYEKATY